MQLFGNIYRDYDGPMQRMEGFYTFLNRSARQESKKMRELLELWFSMYPQDEHFELQRRFENNDEAAFFELFLYALLKKFGCEVIIHPSKEGANDKHPDFFVVPPDGNDFYTEAVVVYEGSQEDQQSQKRINLVYDLLDQMDIPGYLFWIDQNGAPKTQPSVKEIRRFIETQLTQTSRSKIEKAYLSGDFRQLKWQYINDEWELNIYPVPVDTNNEPIERSIGATSHALGEFVNLKRSLRKKAIKYGDFDVPYIIAVNTINDKIDEDDVVEALFGPVEYHYKRHQSGFSYEHEMVRIPDGIWINRQGPINTRVSAVLLTKWLRIDNIPRAEVKLYHNPWAKIPYNSVLSDLTQVVFENGSLREISGKLLGDIFGLPLSWPDI